MREPAGKLAGLVSSQPDTNKKSRWQKLPAGLLMYYGLEEPLLWSPGVSSLLIFACHFIENNGVQVVSAVFGRSVVPTSPCAHPHFLNRIDIE